MNEFYPYFSASFPSSLSSFSRWQDDTNPLLRKRCLAAAAMNCVRSPRNWSCQARARESRRKLVEPHLNFSWKWLEKKTENFRLDCEHLRFFVTLFNEKTHPYQARARSERSDPAQGWVPKLPGLLPWTEMVERSKPEVFKNGSLWLVTRFPPQKTTKPNFDSLPCISEHNTFLCFLLLFFVSCLFF